MLPKRKESKQIYVLQDLDIGTFQGNRYWCFLQVAEQGERGNPITKSLWITMLYEEGTKIKSVWPQGTVPISSRLNLNHQESLLTNVLVLGNARLIVTYKNLAFAYTKGTHHSNNMIQQ